TFLRGFAGRAAALTPLERARATIYVNTRRAQRGLEALLVRDQLLPGPLPRIAVIGDLAHAGTDLPPPVAPLKRQLMLATLVRQLLDNSPDLAPRAAVFDLAASLATLLDEIQGEGVAPQAIRDIDTGAHSEHWRQARTFLEILLDAWPNLRAEAFGGALDPEARQRARVTSQIAAWQAAPPAHPIIVAGSTGSRSTTRLLMSAVAALPQGALVLPGVDGQISAPLWSRLRAMLSERDGAAFPHDHPQAPFVRLCAGLDVDPATLPTWTEAPIRPARARLVSLSLHPAPVTDAWRDAAPAAAAEVTEATDALTLLEAPDSRREALSLAWAIRTAVEARKTVALITPDRTLARRVTAALARWRIRPDDSAGRPLHLTPPGVLTRLTLDALAQPLTPRTLLALLKHPLTGGQGEARGRHLRLVEALELQQLRGRGAVIRWPALAAWAAARDAAPNPPEPAASTGSATSPDDQGKGRHQATPAEAATAWSAWLADALEPLAAPGDRPLADWIALHRRALETLSAGPGGTDPGLWDKLAGEAARGLFDRLAEAAPGIGPLSPVEYRALLTGLLTAEQVREEGFLPRPDVLILGALEARMQSADMVIIGGLNEGIWPGAPRPDPWLNRRMRLEAGLPSPERQTGLAAHDYQNAVNAPEVILSRAVAIDGAPAVPSRWLNRLLNLAEGLGPPGEAATAAMRARGAHLLAQAAAFDRIEAPVPAAPRPAPAPPAAARLTRLSVTDVERLIRDPYAIYAKRILGLKPLMPLGPGPLAMERGTTLHRVMEAFVARLADGWPEDAERVFRTVLGTVLEGVEADAVRLAWSARLLRILPALLTREETLRANGTPLAQEVAAETTVAGVTLTAKADRIDHRPDGTLAIYDYKTGRLPTAKTIGPFDKQLLLEGMLAEEGAFSDLDPATVGHLEYLGLGTDCPSFAIPDLAEHLARTRNELITLLTVYASPERGFASRIRVQKAGMTGDYDHLARHGEWADSDAPVTLKVGR
ncbi:MAG: double-strand break repair protein AddB, partial [Pseudomonadota bacterium]